MNQYAWWDLYGSLLLMSAAPLALLLAAAGVAYWRLRRQNAFMDHQQGVSARIANQNASYYDMLCFIFHFTPTSASWLNAVEGFFANLAKKRLKRGVFRSLQELKDAIHRFLDYTNVNPKPFTWTKDPNKIIAAVKRGHQV